MDVVWRCSRVEKDIARIILCKVINKSCKFSTFLLTVFILSNNSHFFEIREINKKAISKGFSEIAFLLKYANLNIILDHILYFKFTQNFRHFPVIELHSFFSNIHE